MKSSMRTALLLTIGLAGGVFLAIGHGVLAEKDTDTAVAPLPLEELAQT